MNNYRYEIQFVLDESSYSDALLIKLGQKSYKKALCYATAKIVEMYTDCLSKIKNA